jgi:DNA-binding transcriptional regulator YiaG
MPNIATLLKDEISRLARKEIRTQTDALKKASSQHRRDIAALKRQIKDLEQQVTKLAGRTGKEATAPEATAEIAVPLRFTAKGLRSQRKRVGLSAGDYAKLLGVTPQSVYNWERGSSRPRRGQLEALAALRGIGKKEVMARLKEAAQ